MSRFLLGYFSVDLIRRYLVFSMSIIFPAIFALLGFKIVLSLNDAIVVQLISYSWVFFSLTLNFDFGVARVLARQNISIKIQNWNSRYFLQFSVIVQLISSLILFLIFLALFFCGVSLGWIKSPLPYGLTILIFFAGLFSSTLLVLVRYIDESNGKLAQSSLAGGLVGSIIFAVPSLLLFWGCDGYFSFYALHFFRALLIVVIFYFRMYRSIKGPVLKRHEFILFWRSTYPLIRGSFLTNLIALFMSFSDRIVFSFWMPATFSIAYNAVSDLCGRLALIPAVGVRIAMKNIDEALINNSNKNEFMNKGYIISFICVVFFVVLYYPVFFFLENWLGKFYSADLLLIFSIAYIQILFSSVVFYSHSIAVPLGKTGRAAIVQMASLFSFLSLIALGLVYQNRYYFLVAAFFKVAIEVFGFYLIYSVCMRRNLIAIYSLFTIFLFSIFFLQYSFKTGLL